MPRPGGARGRRRLALGLAVGVALAALPARATFHLWKVNEVFSNADGSVQFIELHNDFALENLIAGHHVFAEAGATILATFTFPANLPTTDTAGRTLLLATPGFFDVAGVMPDGEIPAGFIDPVQATTIDYDGLDAFPLAGLPTDGVRSLQRDAPNPPTAGPATPTNFAGEVGSVPEPGAGWIALGAAATLAGLAAWQGCRARRP
jgi:serralysin